MVPRRRASSICRIRWLTPGPNAVYEIDETFDLGDVAPMIAKPFSPGNAFPADEVARERLDVRQGDDRIVHERQLRRSAAGRARDCEAARATGPDESRHANSRCFPARAAWRGSSSAPISGWAASRSRNVFRAAGAVIRQSWCGPCFGQGPDQLRRGQRAITTFNRNWQNRMGLGGEGYLASPAVVAASALARLHGPAERARPRLGPGVDTERLTLWLKLIIALVTLTFLEIVLGVDNVIFISILSGKLPKEQQKRARRVGLMAAMLMRIALLFSITWIARLTEPLFHVMGAGHLRPRPDPASAAACSCIAKATYEIHDKLEGRAGHGSGKVGGVVRAASSPR